MNQRVSGAKLPQFSLPLFEAQAEDIEIEPLELCRIGRTQHDVIDPNNIKRRWHGGLPFLTQPIVARSVSLGGRGL
jgi:hypothetical protein